MNGDVPVALDQQKLHGFGESAGRQAGGGLKGWRQLTDESKKRPLAKSWLPWAGVPSRRDLICWYSIWAVFAYSLLMWPLKPWLIGTNPVLQEAMTGTQTSMTIAGAFARVGEAPIALALVAGVLGLMKFSWIFWWAGKLWGERIVRFFLGSTEESKKAQFFLRRDLSRNWIARAAVVLAHLPLIPAPLAYTSAGWAGMRLTTFLALNFAGSLAWVGLFSGLGYVLGQPAVSLAETYTRYALWISLGTILLIVFIQLRMAKRMFAEQNASANDARPRAAEEPS